jgi:predicted SprT family Zn-dependent metalloprotease
MAPVAEEIKDEAKDEIKVEEVDADTLIRNRIVFATSWANYYLQVHGLVGWQFILDRGLNRAGCCDYRKQTISLSRYFVTNPVVSLNLIYNVIAHEVAHALTPGCGHNEVWRGKFIELGGDGERCVPFAFSTFRYICYCPCGQSYFYRHRIKKAFWNEYKCHACGDGVSIVNVPALQHT